MIPTQHSSDQYNPDQQGSAAQDQTIDISIERIDIKGQYIQLAAPVHIYGHLDSAALFAQYLTNDSQEVRHDILQIGVDEAGRGPLLGSVNVAAAILPATWSGLIEDQLLKETPLSILTDSKKLSEKKRDLLYPLVQQYAVGYIIADIPAAVIDQVNILQATMLGMRLCTEILLEAVASHLTQAKNMADSLNVEVLFDGNRSPEISMVKSEALGLLPCF